MKPCPICETAPQESFKSRYLRVLKCANPSCGHLYAADAPPDHGVQRHADPEAERKKYWARNRRLVSYWAKHGFLNSNSKVLDFGAGSGHISLAIREFMGISAITCLEADPDSQAWLKKCGLEVAIDLGNCPPDFSAVLLVELIEHVDSPIELLRNLKKHMGTGGKLFLSTPCGETRAGSRKTNAYDTPEHIHFFTEKSLRLALGYAGFGNVQYRLVPQLYPRPNGVIGTVTTLSKNFIRSIRDRIFGYSHLVAIVE